MSEKQECENRAQKLQIQTGKNCGEGKTVQSTVHYGTVQRSQDENAQWKVFRLEYENWFVFSLNMKIGLFC